MDEYEIFDVLETLKTDTLELNSEQFVYVPRAFFDVQVRCGQENNEKIIHQVNIDIPRCNFKVEGERMRKLPDHVSLRLARYCTQTVMGMPVEMLTRVGLVAEPKRPKPMKVDIWGEHVCARKKLRVLIDGKKWMPVEVIINADMSDPCVLLRLKTGSSEDQDDLDPVLYDQEIVRRTL